MAFKLENDKLIEHVRYMGYLKSKKVENALKEVPRHNFVPEDIRELAYRDSPLSIGHGQTISQPSTVVAMTEALDVKLGQKVLEIGTGSGWQAAILSKLVGESGFVYTIEIIPELVNFAKNNIKKLNVNNVEVIEGDGSLGLKEHAPFDRIIVTAACPDVPKPLLDQLKINGIIVIPIGNPYLQEMNVIEKTEDGIKRNTIGSFMFVPLVGKYGFKE